MQPQGEAALTSVSFREDYVHHLLGYVDVSAPKPPKIVVNAGNGTAGLVTDALAPHLPFEYIRIHHEPDPDFPNGIPNPLLPENRGATAEAVKAHGADFGVAWDGDFDRCFLFDESGTFIEGYYIVGLLAEALFQREPGAKIIHDPRLLWNTVDVVTAAGGVPIQSKTGHAFIKERMRQENAIYGGEMSAHHYFRGFAYCDNGMIPWLLVASLISENGAPLSAQVGERMRKFPASGEINRTVSSIPIVLDWIESAYGPGAVAVDRTDGISLEFKKLALQSARLKHRAHTAPQRRIPRRRKPDASKDRGTPGADRRMQITKMPRSHRVARNAGVSRCPERTALTNLRSCRVVRAADESRGCASAEREPMVAKVVAPRVVGSPNQLLREGPWQRCGKLVEAVS